MREYPFKAVLQEINKLAEKFPGLDVEIDDPDEDDFTKEDFLKLVDKVNVLSNELNEQRKLVLSLSKAVRVLAENSRKKS
jgi:hypothetical protein